MTGRGGRRLALLARDVGRLPGVRRILRLPALQFVLVLPTAAVVAVVVVSAGLGLDNPSANFGTVVTWVVWWGGLLLSVLVLGRVWCLVCPLGAVGEWLQRLSPWWRSSWAAGLDRAWPRRLRNLWPATGLFVVFVFLDSGYGMSNSPRMTAGLIVVVALVAAWVSLVFERRAFCRYLCPLTPFIGLGAFVSPFELRVRDPAACRTRCASKDCFRGNAHRYGCPMGEFPGGGLDSNLYCILCTECVRSCTRDNIALRFRAFGRDLWALRKPRLDGAAAAVVIVGLTTIVPALMLGLLPPARRALAAILPAGVPPNDPPRLAAVGLLFAVGLGASLGLVTAFAALARWAAGVGRVTTRTLFTRYAYALVPIGLAKWLADLLDHALRTWGTVPEVTRALLLDFPWNRVPPGRLTATHFLPPAGVYPIQALLLLAGLALSLAAMSRIARRLGLDAEAAFATLLPMAGFALLVTAAALWSLGAALL